MTFRPLRDYLLIEPLERQKSDILAVVQHEKPNLGRVVAVGPGKRDKKGRIRPLDARTGDLVRFGTDEGYLSYTELKLGAERFLVLQEADVAFVVDPS